MDGIACGYAGLPGFLTSSSKLQRLQNLSFAILGQRSTLTVAVMRSDSRLLQGAFSLGDDFVMTARSGNGLEYIGESPSYTKLRCHSQFWRNATRVLIRDWRRDQAVYISWTSLVARRTSVGLQLRRVLSDGNVSQYGESAIMGFITHRF